MIRSPQAPSYFFVIDVTSEASQNGYLKVVAETIKKSLGDIPGGSRTQIGFLTYDHSVHYYSFKADYTNPQMMVVADLKELFVPAPDDLFVNLKESRELVESFLDNLPLMFSSSPNNVSGNRGSCLGPALKAAFTVMRDTGGKMCVFQSTLPNLGDGALKHRENARLMGTQDEVKVLKPGNNWYKDTAIEFSRAQISVDMFLFPTQYIDAASLVQLPEYTAGTLHTYPMFNSDSNDKSKLEGDLLKILTQETAFEAVMRIRCTKGMRISGFYGNFFIRGSDLLALPNCTSESVFGFQMVHDEQTLHQKVVTVQGALLYTSSSGQRRIRVMTQAIPVTTQQKEFVNGIDADVLANLVGKQQLDTALRSNLETARSRIQKTCVDIVRGLKQGDNSMRLPPGRHQPVANPAGDEDDPLPENLKLLPLYFMSLVKNVAFRGGTDIHPDERIQAMHYLKSIWITEGNLYIYPKMFSIHNMNDQAGRPSPDKNSEAHEVAGRDRILLPDVLNMSVDRLQSDGIFLVYNSADMYLWVGRSVNPVTMNSLFGVDSLDNANSSMVSEFMCKLFYDVLMSKIRSF